MSIENSSFLPEITEMSLIEQSSTPETETPTESEEEEPSKRIEVTQKIRNLLNENDFTAILPFLSEEDRGDFADTIVEAYDERNSKLFWRKLQAACAETQDEAKRRRIQEDIQATISMEDLKRSEKKKSFSKNMNQRLRTLFQGYSNNEYLTLQDQHLLEDHLDDRAFTNAKQSRINKQRAGMFKAQKELGDINSIGDTVNNRDNTIREINRIIREKREFIARGGDLNNSTIDFDKQIEQLSTVLDDIERVSKDEKKDES